MEINNKYILEIKKDSILSIEMIKKDLVLSYILQELNFSNLIFKGGTLLSKGHLKYHRLSEDLDFSYILPESNSKTQKNKFIKEFIKKEFLPKLLKISQKYGLDFKNDMENNSSNRYCPVKQSDFLYRFNIYLNEKEINPIKIEINFLDKCYFDPKKIKLIHINPKSKYLIYPLKNCEILSYDIKEVILEKFRAILTREIIQERDFFDLFLIQKEFNEVFQLQINLLILKLKDSRLYFKEKKKLISLIGNFEQKFEKKNIVLSEIKDMTLISFNEKEYSLFVEEVMSFIYKNIKNIVKNINE